MEFISFDDYYYNDYHDDDYNYINFYIYLIKLLYILYLSYTDDKKIGGVLKKLALTDIKGVEEVNIFKSDGSVIHIREPKSKCYQTYYHHRRHMLLFIIIVFLLLLLYSYISYYTLIVQASVPSNTYVVSGICETKKLENLVPGILTQLGPEEMDYIRAFADSMKTDGTNNSKVQELLEEDDEDDDDDDIPDLVENFEEAAAK
jgi:nascent polypeptide-associated complex subunit beta